MPRPKKTYKIKRGRPKASKQAKQRMVNGDSPDEEIKVEIDLSEVFNQSSQNFKEETPIKKVVKMDPRDLSNLSEE